jgi:hypothetical protein
MTMTDTTTTTDTAALETWSQYDRAQAGYYRDSSRSARRQREIAAHAAGLVQPPFVLNNWAGRPCGAPGLLGGNPTPEAEREARRLAYPEVGKLP